MSEATRRFDRRIYGTMHESPDGDWVRYGDLALAIQRAEAAEAKYGVANECHEYALRLYKETKAERDALRYSNAMLSRIVQDQLADLGLKGIGDHLSQYLLPDDECDKCGVLRKVDDEMVERAARATMNRVYKDNDLFADDEELLRIHREYARIAITAALAVQP